MPPRIAEQHESQIVEIGRAIQYIAIRARFTGPTLVRPEIELIQLPPRELDRVAAGFGNSARIRAAISEECGIPVAVLWPRKAA